MVNFKVIYKKNEYLPELLTVRVVSNDMKFFLEALDYLKNFRKVKVHVCTSEDHPTLQFHIIGEDKLNGIVRDLNDIKSEVEESHKEALKRHNAFMADVKAKRDQEEKVKDSHNPSIPNCYDKALNRNDSSRCCGTTDANRHEPANEHVEENKPDNDHSVIKIEISGDEDVKRKFIERLVAAAKGIAEDLMEEE